MYLNKLNQLKHDSESYLRHYIRYLAVQEIEDISLYPNLSGICKKDLATIFMENLSNNIGVNKDRINQNTLSNRRRDKANKILDDLIGIRDLHISFEDSFIWAQDSSNKRATYFLCTMLKLVLISATKLQVKQPATYLIPQEYWLKQKAQQQKKRQPNRKMISNISAYIKEQQDMIAHDLKASGYTEEDEDTPTLESNALLILDNIKEICPNKSECVLETIKELCEQALFALDIDTPSRRMNETIKSIETAFLLAHKVINENWAIFKTTDKEMIDWLYKKLIKAYSFIPLSPAMNFGNKKNSILNIIDVLYITLPEELFHKELKKIKDAFSRKKMTLAKRAIVGKKEAKDQKAAIEKRIITIDSKTWRKLNTISGSSNKIENEIILKALIEQEFEKIHDNS